jgi:hypothetical protein
MSQPVEDFLDEDTEIPGQQYVLLSFLSPEKVLDKKELFFFERFLQSYEIDWKIKNLEKFLVDTVKGMNEELDAHARDLESKDQAAAAEICRKNRVRIDDVIGQYQSFVTKSRADVTKTKIVEAYDDFMYTNKAKLENEFHVANDCHTTIRGIKVRGAFATTKEAELKAKKLQGRDKYHNIFMAEMGKWTPWDPSPNDVKEQEYYNDQLNGLMKKYKENEDNREQFFEERTKSGKQVVSSTSSVADSMFGGQDLAMQRKLEKPVVTIQPVQDEKAAEAAEPATPQ